MKERVLVRLVSECQGCALTTWHVPKWSERILEAYGVTRDMARDARQSTSYEGGFTFHTGCGYAIFDADLLGGNGDGQTEKMLNWRGLVVQTRGSARKRYCADCANGL